MVNYWSRTITCYAMTFDNDIDDLEMHGPQCQSLSELNLQYQGWLHSWLHPWGFLQWVPTAQLGENKQMWKNKVYDDFKHFVKLKWGQYWFKMSSEAPPPSYEEALNQDSRSFFSSVPNLSQFDWLPVLTSNPILKKITLFITFFSWFHHWKSTRQNFFAEWKCDIRTIGSSSLVGAKMPEA